MIVDNKLVSYENFMHNENIKLSTDKEFIEFIDAGHEFLIKQIRDGRPIYGITTGYGEAGSNYAAFEEAEELQKNLYRFCGVGVGEYLSADVSKIMVTIRLISLSKGKSGVSYNLLKRFELSYSAVKELSPAVEPLSQRIKKQVEIEIKYEGYIARQINEIKKYKNMEKIKIPEILDYSIVPGLSNELVEKLSKIKPISLGQASRIDGITPAAISVIMIAISAQRRKASS